ncbi:MAG: hypothetical protein ACJ764_03065 [Solirubrobacteraceae bacterium]
MAALLLALLSGTAMISGLARAAGLDQTCELTATRFDADTLNVLFPDSSAQYWSTHYVAVPGTRIRIEGIFPYARYTSWNVYDPVLRPFAKKSDFELRPDPGSSNPFLPGAARNTPQAQRHYTLFITFDPADHPGPNTLYVDPSQNPVGLMTLRVYVPDAGRDATGGVGLPQVTWEPTSTTSSPGASSPCRSLEKPTSNAVTSAYASQDGPQTGPPYPGHSPPDWHRFVNLCQSGSDLLLDNQIGDQLPNSGQNPCTNFGSGGFLSNMDNAYVYAFISRGFGPIVVFRGQAPTFAATYPDAAVMPTGPQLRYWSFCQNDPIDQRYVGCRRDDQTTVDRSRDYTIVVSSPSAWPAAARQRCRRVTSWIPWGPQPDGVMIYRQMLADPSFTQAIQKVSYGSEHQQMGPYYPVGRYFSDWHGVAGAFC